MNIEQPKKSPTLDQFCKAILIDQLSNRFPLLAVLPVDSSGHIVSAGLTIKKGQVSNVTAIEGEPQVHNGSNDIPTVAICGLDSAGAPISFAALIASLLPAAPGKFQSAIRTATGAEETIAHGLAVVPSIVLVSVYDDNAAAFTVLEGVHDATDLKVTVTVGAKFKVIALA